MTSTPKRHTMHSQANIKTQQKRRSITVVKSCNKKGKILKHVHTCLNILPYRDKGQTAIPDGEDIQMLVIIIILSKISSDIRKSRL